MTRAAVTTAPDESRTTPEIVRVVAEGAACAAPEAASNRGTPLSNKQHVRVWSLIRWGDYKRMSWWPTMDLRCGPRGFCGARTTSVEVVRVEIDVDAAHRQHLLRAHRDDAVLMLQ